MNAVLTWLYVPATRPDRFDKALRSIADIVIIDLQDSVVEDRKDEARANACKFIGTLGEAARRVEVRVNAVGTDVGLADLEAIAALRGLHAVRVPSVNTAADVHAADRLLNENQRLYCLVESALGVENAFAVAQASPRVTGIGLGEADLISDLNLADTAGLAWARGRLVVAARAAGLTFPAMSAYPRVNDPVGLAAHCAIGRRLGFLGCAAIHPDQLPTIVAAFRPTDTEVAAAGEVLAALKRGRAGGNGAVRTSDGRMIDPAMRRRAEQILALNRRADANPH